MGELRDVTVQYTSCADPTESAARKRRVLQGEARGLMAETAANIIEAAITSSQTFLEHGEFQTTTIPEESQDLPIHPSIVQTSGVPEKKKRGRPPLNKSQNKNPLNLIGAKSSKRNKGLIQNSPKRKASAGQEVPPREENPGNIKKPAAKQRLILQDGGIIASSSTAAPRIAIIPAIAKNKVLLGKYCQSSSLLDCSVSSTASHGWRGICIGRDLLKTQLGKAIGSGSDTLVWSEPWLSLFSTTIPFGPPTKQNQCLRMGAPDRYVWLLTKTGEYSAKSGYQAASMEAVKVNNQISIPADFNWNKEIWNSKSSPKVKFFLWKAMKNALPVGKNLQARGINQSATCPHCGDEETSLHLFFHCRFARQVWDQAPFKHSLNPSQITSMKLGIEASKRLLCLPPTGLGDGSLLPWILWMIWVCRNKKIFEQKHLSSLDVLSQAITQAKEWTAAQSIDPISKSRLHTSPITSTSADTIQCFSDAAWREESKEAGFGWVFLDHLSKSEKQGK
ncbi:unnamed protein product, partial [Arabidopsis halleri]